MRLLSTIFCCLIVFSFPLRAQQQGEDRLVRLLSAESAQSFENTGLNVKRVTGNARFLHNNALIICDTAIWDVTLNTVDAIGNVKIIQENTTLSGDRIHYLADSSLAQVRGSIVELTDKDSNKLRTFFLDYNTKDSIAYFFNGGSMRDSSGNFMESTKGYYHSKIKRFRFIDDVEMSAEGMLLKCDSLNYWTEIDKIIFPGPMEAWQDGGYLSADSGWYDRTKELYNFENNAYILNGENEISAGKILFNRNNSHATLWNDVQIKDTAQSLILFSDYAYYKEAPLDAILYDNPSAAYYTMEGDIPDTLFFAADTIKYKALPKFKVDSATVASSEKRYTSSKRDPIEEMFGNKAKAALVKEHDNALATKPDDSPTKQLNKALAIQSTDSLTAQLNDSLVIQSTDSLTAQLNDSLAIQSTDSLTAQLNDSLVIQSTDSLTAQLNDSLVIQSTDSLTAQLNDSLVIQSTDSLTAQLNDSLVIQSTDSLTAQLNDSLAIQSTDSLAIQPRDTTLIRFVDANKNVRFYRSNIQGVSDSLVFNNIDSIIRLYKDPVLWNEQNQFSGDSIQIVMSGDQLRKVDLLSNSFVASKEDSLHYNQVKASDISAYFTKGKLSRFDAYGGVSVIVFLAEDSLLTTMNKKESKVMTAKIKEQSLQRTKYIEAVKNEGYPIIDLAPEDKVLRGFNIRENERPLSRFDVCDRIIKPSEREEKNNRALPLFKYTERLFGIKPR